jgi:hypothetical protein
LINFFDQVKQKEISRDIKTKFLPNRKNYVFLKI